MNLYNLNKEEQEKQNAIRKEMRALAEERKAENYKIKKTGANSIGIIDIISQVAKTGQNKSVRF